MICLHHKHRTHDMIDMVNLTCVVKIDIHTETVEFWVLSLVEHKVLAIFLCSMNNFLHNHVVN